MKLHNLFLLVLAVILLSFNGTAQTPQGINYQAVARDGNGDLITNGSLDVKIGIYSGANGTAKEYEETHSGVPTDDYGHFNLIVGQGAASVGTFSAIQWGSAKHHIQVEIDNGNGFVNIGKVALQSSPYALHAGSVDQVPTINMADLGDVNNSPATNGQVLKWNGTEWAPANDATGGGGGLTPGIGIDITGGVIEAKNTDGIWNANKLRGEDISSQSPSNGDFLKYNGSLWEPATDNDTKYNAGSGLSLNSGTFAADSHRALWNANQLQGTSIASQSPNTDDVLKYNGTSWTPGTDNDTKYSAGNGLSLSSGVFYADSNRAIWNAKELQGNTVDTTSPVSGEFLSWDGSNWTPTEVKQGEWNAIGTTYLYSRKQIGIGIDSALTNLHVVDTILGTANANYANSLFETEGATGALSTTYGIWNQVEGRNGYQNVGIRSFAGGTANNTYVGGGATGGEFVAQTDGGQNNFGVRADAGEDGSARNYAFYGHSRGDGQFNMGVFALADKSSNSASITNYGIFAWADSAQTNYAGYFDGDVTYTGSLSSASDARFKEEVAPVENALGLVKNLNVKTYYFKKTGDAAKLNLSSGRQYGFIAQELEAVIPELVTTQKHAVGVKVDDEPDVIEFKGVNYIGLIPVLTKAIQEQQETIEALQKRIEQLENQ